jgi:hypothetical protein
MNFAELLKDNRQLSTVRHLRRIYMDPMTNSQDWGVVRAPDGGIMGVHSNSNASSLKQHHFLAQDEAFEGAKNYSDWKFIYEPGPLPSK